MTCLRIFAAEDHEGGKASERGVRVLNVDANNGVRRWLKINCEKHISRSGFCA